MFVFDLILLAQYSNTRGGGGPSSGPDFTGVCCCWGFLFLGLLANIPMLIGAWKVFEKAGEPGVYSIIPIYNMMVMARLAGKDETYGLLCLIPCVGVIFAILIMVDLCNQFDVGGGFAVGLILLPYIFWPILGFGSARYQGRRRRRRDYDDDYDRRRRYDDDDDDRRRGSTRDDYDDRGRGDSTERPRRPRLPEDDDYRERWDDR